MDGGQGEAHFMAVIEYDGTDFSGFQMQPRERTVQGEVEKVLASLTQMETRIVGAGRTDAGVHATGQVISFVVSWGHPLEDLKGALNALLPADIAVRELKRASEDFNARRSARSREYCYTILDRPVRSPLERRFAYHFPAPLDSGLMQEAALRLKGTHDFASFGRAPSGTNTIREIYRIECSRDGDHIYVELEANAFLRRMVRSIVGTLLWAGTGELSADDFEAILSAREREGGGKVVPAHGLCLIRVNY